MCVCFSCLRSQRENQNYLALGCIILVITGLHSFHEVKPGRRGGINVPEIAALSISHSQIRERVTSSGLPDPAACLGSEAKPNWDLHKKVRPFVHMGVCVAEGPPLLQTDLSPAGEAPFQHLQRPSAKHIYFGSRSRDHTHWVV